MISPGRLGLDERSPSEIVLSTFLPNGSPHASVVGVKVKGDGVVFRVFTDTRTYENLVGRRAAVINIIRDVRLMAKLALKRLTGFDTGGLSFTGSTRVDAPKLEGAEAHLEIEVKSIDREEISDELGPSEVAEILGEVKGAEIQSPAVRPFKRSEFLVIESAVLASRIAEADRRGKRSVAKALREELGVCRGKCEAVAPGSEDLQTITEIIDALG